jgi:2-polyprenyl-3-methyl-5-hydroxy-6-metoxy-1,4-benzoquinol methylase
MNASVPGLCRCALHFIMALYVFLQPMLNEKCILCNSNQLSVTEKINTDGLIRLYKKRAGVDVGRFFKEKQINYCTCNNCGLKMYLPQVIGDGTFYDDLQKYKGYYLHEKSEFTEAAKFIHPADDVLEVGSGEGLFVSYISFKSYTGLEFSEDAISKARKIGIHLQNQSVEDHCRENRNKYDVVCCFQVLEHVPNPGKFIKACLDCLKPEGRLIVAVPSADSFIRDAVNFYLNMPPHHASTWTDHALEKLADLNQLRIMHVFHEPLHPMHRIFYNKTAIYNNLGKKFGHPYRMMDKSARSWFLYSLSNIGAHLKNIFSADGTAPVGQSVTFVYQKQF